MGKFVVGLLIGALFGFLTAVAFITEIKKEKKKQDENQFHSTDL